MDGRRSFSGALTHDDLRQVFAKTYRARSKWPNVLLALGVDNATIATITSTHRDSDDAYRIGLSRWLSSGSGTWKDMAEAMSDPTVGHQDIANDIEREYLQGGESNIIGAEPLPKVFSRSLFQMSSSGL